MNWACSFIINILIYKFTLKAFEIVDSILSSRSPPASVPKIPQTIVIPPNMRSALLWQRISTSKNITTCIKINLMNSVNRSFNFAPRIHINKCHIDIFVKRWELPYDKYHNQPSDPSRNKLQWQSCMQCNLGQGWKIWKNKWPSYWLCD